jgi:hypothetical protein
MAIARTAGGNAAFHNFHNDLTHIQDPNERRRLALAQIDEAPFGWYHVRACVVAGIGFFTGSYDVSHPALSYILLKYLTSGPDFRDQFGHCYVGRFFLAEFHISGLYSQ